MCESCGKSFFRSSTLKAHRKRHIGEEPKLIHIENPESLNQKANEYKKVPLINLSQNKEEAKNNIAPPISECLSNFHKPINLPLPLNSPFSEIKLEPQTQQGIPTPQTGYIRAPIGMVQPYVGQSILPMQYYPNMSHILYVANVMPYCDPNIPIPPPNNIVYYGPRMGGFQQRPV